MFVQPYADLISLRDNAILIPLTHRIQVCERRDAVDDNGAGPVILVGVLVPDIDLLGVAQGNICGILASNEYT